MSIPSSFDSQPHLVGTLVELRPLDSADFAALYAAASDPLIWKQHPDPTRFREDVFRTVYPTAAAASLIDPGCTALPDVLAVAAGPGPDRLAGARQELKSCLLGPDHPDALTRFNNAVETLATRAARLAGADVAPGAAAAEEGPAVRAVSGA